MVNEIYITSLLLKHFRCFTKQQFDISHPVMVFEGSNGSGKTSLLEAMYCSAYLRSFRASSVRDLVQFGSNNFFITTSFGDHEVSVGVLVESAGIKRHIKIDQKSVTSHRELHDYCRVITTTEDDLLIIKGGPDRRRAFIDQALFLMDVETVKVFKMYKEILEQRTALLHKGPSFEDEQFLFWTERLWDISIIIQNQRKDLLTILIERATPLLASFWPDARISIEYEQREMKPEHLTFQDFLKDAAQPSGTFASERRLHRGCFGAHLDDIEIKVNGKKARYFSSRGQQKLLVMVLKLALLQHILETQGKTAFLLDDFTTDLDQAVVEKLMTLCLATRAQLIFASPVYGGQEVEFLRKNSISFGTITLP